MKYRYLTQDFIDNHQGELTDIDDRVLDMTTNDVFLFLPNTNVGTVIVDKDDIEKAMLIDKLTDYLYQEFNIIFAGYEIFNMLASIFNLRYAETVSLQNEPAEDMFDEDYSILGYDGLSRDSVLNQLFEIEDVKEEYDELIQELDRY